jgi:hypothetical protein
VWRLLYKYNQLLYTSSLPFSVYFFTMHEYDFLFLFLFLFFIFNYVKSEKIELKTNVFFLIRLNLNMISTKISFLFVYTPAQCPFNLNPLSQSIEINCEEKLHFETFFSPELSECNSLPIS